jgi:hypothetical protein
VNHPEASENSQSISMLELSFLGSIAAVLWGFIHVRIGSIAAVLWGFIHVRIGSIVVGIGVWG